MPLVVRILKRWSWSSGTFGAKEGSEVLCGAVRRFLQAQEAQASCHSAQEEALRPRQKLAAVQHLSSSQARAHAMLPQAAPA